MKREQVLKRLGFRVPDIKKNRVIVHADIAAEADDPYAVVHHLLTPSEDVVGIIAANYEWRFRTIPSLKPMAGQSMMNSFREGQRILSLLKIDDVPLLKGAVDCIGDREHLPESEGADFIIRAAMKEDDRPLYVALQAGLTDLAVAYLKEPRIAERLTAIWIGGGAYPNGGRESNLQQDIYAAQVLFSSPMLIWQIPIDVYSTMLVSFAELRTRVQPRGEIGKYLFDRTIEINEWYGRVPQRMPFPHGERWSLGDQPTVSVLLMNGNGDYFTERRAPAIQDDMTYREDPSGKRIRVYHTIDVRLTLEDLFAKLLLLDEGEVR